MQLTLGGDPEVEWTVEPDRVARVVVKNARGHALYELGEPLLHAPRAALFSPWAFASSSRPRGAFRLGWSILPESSQDQFLSQVIYEIWICRGFRLLVAYAIRK